MPGLASLCQASRVFGRAPNAREVCCKLWSLVSNKDFARILNYFNITQSVKRPRSTKSSIHNQSGLSKQFIAQSEMEMTEIIFTKKAFHKTLRSMKRSVDCWCLIILAVERSCFYSKNQKCLLELSAFGKRKFPVSISYLCLWVSSTFRVGQILFHFNWNCLHSFWSLFILKSFTWLLSTAFVMPKTTLLC